MRHENPTWFHISMRHFRTILLQWKFWNSIKLCLVHDRLFAFELGFAVNNLVNKEDLLPLTYVKCLSRIAHCIRSLRGTHPETSIAGINIDFRSAFRRVSLHGHLVDMRMYMVWSVVIISFSLEFGGEHFLARWCPFSEITCDLKNNLLNNEDWDTVSFTTSAWNSSHSLNFI